MVICGVLIRLSNRYGLLEIVVDVFSVSYSHVKWSVPVYFYQQSLFRDQARICGFCFGPSGPETWLLCELTSVRRMQPFHGLHASGEMAWPARVGKVEEALQGRAVN